MRATAGRVAHNRCTLLLLLLAARASTARTPATPFRIRSNTRNQLRTRRWLSSRSPRSR